LNLHLSHSSDSLEFFSSANAKTRLASFSACNTATATETVGNTQRDNPSAARNGGMHSTCYDQLGNRRMSVVSSHVLLCGITFVLSFTACVPYPHEAIKSPEISGVVLRNGVGVAGFPIFRATAPSASPCANADERTLTDSNGKFSFPEKRGVSWFVGMPDVGYDISHCKGRNAADKLWPNEDDSTKEFTLKCFVCRVSDQANAESRCDAHIACKERAGYRGSRRA